MIGQYKRLLPKTIKNLHNNQHNNNKKVLWYKIDTKLKQNINRQDKKSDVYTFWISIDMVLSQEIVRD